MRAMIKALLLTATLLASSAALWAGPRAIPQPMVGRLAGVVADLQGTPQMGATIWIVGQSAKSSGPIKIFTNENGVFSVDNLLPGLYSIRVSLASYLPVIKKNISVEAGQRAFLTFQLSTLFDSLQKLSDRRSADLEEDEWKWVLRTSAATRPVLRLLHGQVDVATSQPPRPTRPRGMLQLSSGVAQGSGVGSDLSLVSSLFAYDQALPDDSHLLLAGGFAYNRMPGGILGVTWTPGLWTGTAPQISLSLRQSYVPRSSEGQDEARLAYRGLKFGFSNSFQITPRVHVDYGMDYVAVNLNGTTQAILPRGTLVYEPTRRARVEFLVASSTSHPVESLAGASEAINVFPGVTLSGARPHLENVFHQEVRFGYRFSNHAALHAAAFRDRVQNAALFGRTSDRSMLDPGDFLLDPTANGFSFNGGNYAALGARVVYQQTLYDRLETTLGYSNIVGLVPVASFLEGGASLHDILRTQRRHALTARLATRLPRLGTRVAAGYRWYSGTVVGAMDPFDESAGRLDPNLSLQLRQPLPQFYLLPGRLEVLADIRNLLAQGYIPITSADGQILYLVPAFRSFRGGVSFQF